MLRTAFTPLKMTLRLLWLQLPISTVQITSGKPSRYSSSVPQLILSRNGRWRSLYIFSPSESSLSGTIKVDVHYYEDGNVRLLTTKPISSSVSSASASSILREIAVSEKKYQEEINKGFNNLSEGAFKGLRRQLPITRQKIEWDKIAGYRLGQDIGGGSTRRQIAGDSSIILTTQMPRFYDQLPLLEGNNVQV